MKGAKSCHTFDETIFNANHAVRMEKPCSFAVDCIKILERNHLRTKRTLSMESDAIVRLMNGNSIEITQTQRGANCVWERVWYINYVYYLWLKCVRTNSETEKNNVIT